MSSKVLQNTDHVMNCDLGKWYSDDKKTAFKVLDRDVKSASVKITFGPEGKEMSKEISKENVEEGHSFRNSTSNDKIAGGEKDCGLEMCTESTGCECEGLSNGCRCKVCECTKLQCDGKNKDCNIKMEKGNYHQEQKSKLNESLVKINDACENQCASKTLDGSEFSHKTEAVCTSKQMDANMKSFKLEPEYKEMKEQSSAKDNMKQDGKLKSFLLDHTAFFIALSIVNFTLAVLITIFCFICPNAIGNAKIGVERARDWTLSKIETGNSACKLSFNWMWGFLTCVGKCLGLRMPTIVLPTISAYMPDLGNSACKLPFNWMWAFLTCVGKCFGLGMPSFSLPRFSTYLPNCNTSMPKWITCMFNCAKGE